MKKLFIVILFASALVACDSDKLSWQGDFDNFTCETGSFKVHIAGKAKDSSSEAVGDGAHGEVTDNEIWVLGGKFSDGIRPENHTYHYIGQGYWKFASQNCPELKVSQ